MKLLLISQHFVGPNEPGFTRHYELGRYIVQQGHDLTIVASQLNYQTGQRTVDKKALAVEQNIEGVRVLRTYVLPVLHRSFFWRVIAFLSFMFTSIWVGLRAGSVDVVMGTSPPLFQALSAWIVSALQRKPFFLEIRDLWPAFAIDMGVLTNPILIALSSWLEMFLYGRATQIVVNSPAYRNYMIEKGVPEEKVSFIPYGTDINMFNPSIDGLQIREELGITDEFLVIYAGALGLANDIYTLLRAAEHLKDNTNIKIVLFGDGKERPALEEFSQQHNLTNVIFARTRQKTEMPHVLAASDACIAILQNIPMFEKPYPNKVFDHMAAGKPTILAINGVIREVIEAADGGVYVQPGDEKQLAEAIRNLAENPEKAKLQGCHARNYVEEHFDREKRASELIELAASLVQNRQKNKS